MGRFDNWEPLQEAAGKAPLDLRAAALGPKGYKINPIKSSRKRRLGDAEEEAALSEVQQPVAMDADGGELAPAAKRRRVGEGEPYRTVRSWALVVMVL